jgi:hypothetical protein
VVRQHRRLSLVGQRTCGYRRETVDKILVTQCGGGSTGRPYSRGGYRGTQCKAKLPTLANIIGDTVHTADEDNEQYEIPSHLPINGSKTEGTHYGKTRMERT